MTGISVVTERKIDVSEEEDFMDSMTLKNNQDIVVCVDGWLNSAANGSGVVTTIRQMKGCDVIKLPSDLKTEEKKDKDEKEKTDDEEEDKGGDTTGDKEDGDEDPKGDNLKDVEGTGAGLDDDNNPLPVPEPTSSGASTLVYGAAALALTTLAF